MTRNRQELRRTPRPKSPGRMFRARSIQRFIRRAPCLRHYCGRLTESAAVPLQRSDDLRRSNAYVPVIRRAEEFLDTITCYPFARTAQIFLRATPPAGLNTWL